jgi:hypothetical protein
MSSNTSHPRWFRDVISNRPPAKNARLLTWAGPATFSLKKKIYIFYFVVFTKLPTELFYPLQIAKNISFALKSLHHWLKRNIAFHHWLKTTLLKSILKHVKTKF